VDSSTLAVTKRRQLPFGGPRGAASTFPGERGFVGGTQDASTGLTHLGAREYDPDTGRFISVDPVLSAGDPQQLNGYTYSDNNPVTLSDPSGLIAQRCMMDDCGHSGGYNQAAPTPPPPPGPKLSDLIPVAPRKDTRVYSEIGGRAGTKPARISATDVKVWRAELNNAQEKAMRCGSYTQVTLFSDPACQRAAGQVTEGNKTNSRILSTPPPRVAQPAAGKASCDGWFNCLWEASWKAEIHGALDNRVGVSSATTVMVVAEQLGMRSPDYITVEASAFAGFGVTTGFTVTKYGKVVFNKPTGGWGSVGAGGAMRQGWLTGGATKDDVNGFVEGAASGFGGTAALGPLGFSGGLTASRSSTATAVEFGLASGAEFGVSTADTEGISICDPGWPWTC
jgi:RHS repeat-associated protein